jgi:hypothetical protein
MNNFAFYWRKIRLRGTEQDQAHLDIRCYRNTERHSPLEKNVVATGRFVSGEVKPLSAGRRTGGETPNDHGSFLSAQTLTIGSLQARTDPHSSTRRENCKSM